MCSPCNFGLQHYWRLVDSEALALKVRSEEMDRKIACTQAELRDRQSQLPVQWAVVALPSRAIRRPPQSFCSYHGFLRQRQGAGAGSKVTLSIKMLFGYDDTPEALLDDKT